MKKAEEQFNGLREKMTAAFGTKSSEHVIQLHRDGTAETIDCARCGQQIRTTEIWQTAPDATQFPNETVCRKCHDFITEETRNAAINQTRKARVHRVRR